MTSSKAQQIMDYHWSFYMTNQMQFLVGHILLYTSNGKAFDTYKID